MATLVAPREINPVADAEILRTAFEGWGTDEKATISILAHRNAAQRKLIRQTYENLYQEDLVRRLEKELSGNLERAVYRWIQDPADRDAVLANVAIKKGDADYYVIAEIACSRSPEELLAVRRAYQSRYKHSLEEDVAAHTAGYIRALLVSLVSAYRYDGEEINARLAKSEAEILHKTVKDKAFGDEEVIRILSTRSKLQLTATFNHYKEAFGTSLTKSLSGGTSDEYLAILGTVIRSTKDPINYFEKVLSSALGKAGTNEDALTRVIVTRAEKDLAEIKKLYFKRNSVSLEHAVAKETSGKYEEFLLNLVGKQE